MITLLLFCLFPFNWADVISTSSIQCDCGFQDNLTTTWSDVWHMNFQNRPSPSNLYAINDLFFANYIIEAKYNDSYARIFHKENVNTLEDAIQIAITLNQTSNEIICGGFGTTRQDFLYGSFRSFMKSTSVNGSVASMFAYHPQGEIDIEIVSALHPPQAYFAVHPGLTVQSRASPLTHGNWFFSFDPSLDYHEYRFDWLPGLTIFYVDGIERYRMTTNILDQPSRIMFNHWTDGNIKFSQGPVKQDASLYIKNMTFFFNSTDTQPSCLVTNQACKVQDVISFINNNSITLEKTTPTLVSPSSSSSPSSIMATTNAFSMTTSLKEQQNISLIIIISCIFSFIIS